VLVASLRMLNLQGRARARPMGIDRVEYDLTWN
jgi:hypothetical protein